MTHEREQQLLAHVPTLGTLDEALAFRLDLTKQEQLGSELTRSLEARIRFLAAREAGK